MFVDTSWFLEHLFPRRLKSLCFLRPYCHVLCFCKTENKRFYISRRFVQKCAHELPSEPISCMFAPYCETALERDARKKRSSQNEKWDTKIYQKENMRDISKMYPRYRRFPRWLEPGRAGSRLVF